MAFRILSLDGGGLKGLITIGILREIEGYTGIQLRDSFDLVAGTSTGGLIACALALSNMRKAGVGDAFSLENVHILYTERASRIFPRRQSRIGRGVQKLRSLFRPKYDPRGLRDTIEDFFGDASLADCGTAVVIPAYDVISERPLVFTSRYVNRTSVGFSPNRNSLIADICMATTAAPTYFPSMPTVHYGENDGFATKVECIDGGVYLNNPALYALSEVLSNSSDTLYTARNGGQQVTLDNIHLLSIGTGDTFKGSGGRDNWGLVQWGKRIAETMLQSSSQIVDQQLRSLLGNRYHRIDIPLSEEHCSMDDSRGATRLAWEKAMNKYFVKDPVRRGALIDFIRDSNN